MKNLLIILFASILLVSCVSTNIEYYSNPTQNANKVFIQLDQSTASVDVGGVGYTTTSGWTFVASSSETIKLGTIKNKELIKSALAEKGYMVVNTLDEADIVMIGESTSNGDYFLVTLGFYDKAKNQLMYVCEGKYGLGWGIQDDLNKAVLKALESIPPANITFL